MGRFPLLLLGLFLFANLSLSAQQRERVEDYRISHKEGIHTYLFPDHASSETREKWVGRGGEMIAEILELIGETEFSVPVTIEFVPNRHVMFRKTGLVASGMAFPQHRTLYCVFAEKIPLKHELTHMVSMLKWGVPDSTLIWINEGLATYADGLCIPYSWEEIYVYFLQNDQTIPFSNLVDNFYKQEETIAYHQAAFLVQYLINRYGIERFRRLWQKDLNHFTEIYGVEADLFILELHDSLLTNYPEPLDLDWRLIKKGCY